MYAHRDPASLYMKHFLFLIALAVLTLHVAAQIDLNVTNGYAENHKSSQRFTHVWAPANPPGMVFDRWVGDTTLLSDPANWHTRVSLKQKSITLTATFKNAPSWSPTYEQISGNEVGYFFPPNLRGVVFRFHGTGGRGSTYFNTVQGRTSANDLVAAGFAVVSPDSTDRVNRVWSFALPPNNPDIDHIQAIIDLFISRGWMTANTPVFGLGMSNGGAFTTGVSYALDFTAAAIYCAPGSAFIDQTTVPTIWNMQQNDDNDQVGQSGNATARANSQILAERGIATAFHLNVASPFYPQRLARLPGLSLADAQAIYNSFKQNGILDQNDYLVQNPSVSGWENYLPVAYSAYSAAIQGELGDCYAGHNFYSDNDGQVIGFFNAQLPNARTKSVATRSSAGPR